MKWLAEGDTSGMLPQNNGQTSSSQVFEGENLRPHPSCSQDDATVGYSFLRNQSDPDFPILYGKHHGRWALGDDCSIESPATELVFMNNIALSAEHMGVAAMELINQQQRNGQIAPSAKKLWGVEEQKDETKGILNLNDHQRVWRDTTWSTADHTVTQPITMVPRRSGSFPGNEAGNNILSPRSSETSGLGVKMVEYVLGTSPTIKDLEPRMQSLVLNSGDSDKKDKDKSPNSTYETGKKDIENGNAVNVQSNGIVQNGLVNCDDDKGFNRTPGSRQPSPSDEDINKNNGGLVGGGGGGAGMKNHVQENGPDNHLSHQLNHHHHQMSQHPINHLNAVPHLNVNMSLQQQVVQQQQAQQQQQPQQQQHLHNHLNIDSMNQHFEHVMTMDPSQSMAQGFEAGYHPGPGPTATGPPGAILAQQGQNQAAGPGTQGMDSPGVLPNFDIQQLFRSQQPQTTTPQQIQLLQQQQYLATQQQQQQLAGLTATAAPFASAPYLINAQEPYVGTLITGPAVVPQAYYGMGPWVYPANIIQQGATGAPQRRPLTPSSSTELNNSTTNLTQVPQGQYQVIPAYYDQNGSIVMGNVRGIGNGAPMRLVSPAPVIVNAATPGANMRLLGSQPQQIATPPAASSIYSNSQAASLYSNSNGTSVGGGGFPSSSASLGFGSSNLGTIGSPASLSSLGAGVDVSGTGLGLGTGSTGRRDSFDRNTSAFSPSLEPYNRKWPQSYGALGTVTASPSPLGLTSGSLTPPPPSLSAMGSSSNLALGTLMGNTSRSSILSAAPGAEAAKFRNGSVGAHMVAGLNTNGMFGSTSSLFSKFGAGGARATVGSSLEKPPGRSRLLEEFRNNRYPNLALRDLANHIVEFSQDQHGSRFIQQKLERATVAEKQMVFQEILSAAYSLMTDVFGNYVIQKFFEFGTPDQKTTLAQKVRGNVLPLALQMYGCRVIQKALESISPDQQQEIVHELDGHILKCVKDQNGNHVVQKCIECVEPLALQFIINAFQGQVYALSTHPYGCRVIQRILEHCTLEQTAPILEELHSQTEQLIQDQYGNYVIQHVLEHGKPEDKSQIISSVRGKVLVLSQHKFASNVVEKCVTHATRAERSLLIEEVCSFNDSALQVMMKDQYANYVVQKMIDVSEPAQRRILMHKIRPHLSSLRKFTYGKHIIAKLEKFFLKTSNPVTVVGGVGVVGADLGPIGPPPTTDM